MLMTWLDDWDSQLDRIELSYRSVVSFQSAKSRWTLYVGRVPTRLISNTVVTGILIARKYYCGDNISLGAIYPKPYNFTTNTLKAYLSAQPSSLSAFMITRLISVPCGRQLNAKVCGIVEAPFFVFLIMNRKRLKYSP